MFRLQTALTQADALAARILSNPKVQRQHVPVTVPVTQDCIPTRRRRARRQLTASTTEPLRSTWF